MVQRGRLFSDRHSPEFDSQALGRIGGRQFAEDRHSGALELVVSTPLGVKEILRGQWLALRRQFLGPPGLAAIQNPAHINFWTQRCAVVAALGRRTNMRHLSVWVIEFFKLSEGGGSTL